MGIKLNLKQALFLDRDGILNLLINNRPPWKISEIKIYEEAFEIIKIAKNNNYLPIVVSNQPDAGRGALSYKEIRKINDTIMKNLGIDKFYICYHPYDGMCDCRKPKIGSFLKARDELNIDFKKSFMIGDRDKDIIAGKKAGCKTIYLSEGKNENADFIVKNHYGLLKLLTNLLVN